MATRTSTSPRASGIISGAVSGLVMFVVILLMDHFFFSSRETRQYGLVAALIGAGVAGAVFGAIVGLVVVQTRSMPAGVATGAVLFALLKLAAIGAAGAFSVGAVIFGLIYGAVFGWAVTGSVVKAMDQAGG